jgi:predicted GIY-YIG superfamily endonuclease
MIRGDKDTYNRVKYVCQNCGWSATVREEWADLKPKKCGNKKCETSFRKYPDKLLILKPEKSKKPEVTVKEAEVKKFLIKTKEQLLAEHKRKELDEKNKPKTISRKARSGETE